jgi:hypothetical protein
VVKRLDALVTNLEKDTFLSTVTVKVNQNLRRALKTKPLKIIFCLFITGAKPPHCVSLPSANSILALTDEFATHHGLNH